jgi:hypothetical protein
LCSATHIQALEIDGGVGWRHHSVRFDFGQVHKRLSISKTLNGRNHRPEGRLPNQAGFDFDVLSLVPFFGRAKKGTALKQI